MGCKRVSGLHNLLKFCLPRALVFHMFKEVTGKKTNLRENIQLRIANNTRETDSRYFVIGAKGSIDKCQSKRKLAFTKVGKN